MFYSLKKELTKIKINTKRIQSSKNIDGEKLIWKMAEYYRTLSKHISNPVRFTSCLQTMYDNGIDTFVEIGPGRTLSNFVKRMKFENSIKIMNVSNCEELETDLGQKLMNKVAFITGGTRGIGKQIAITLANEGYDIAINYRQENKELEETRNEVRNNVKCLAVKGNIAKFEDTKSMATKIIEAIGKIDVLVNNAGITKDMLLLRMKAEDFRNVIDVNLNRNI